MHYNNHTSHIKRRILIRLLELVKENRLESGIDQIPFEMTGPGYVPIRCCVHHDRELMRHRILAWLGFSPREEHYEGGLLSDYATRAMTRKIKPQGVLTVLDEACNACVKTQFLVTNACQGCLARPCAMNCPRKSIAFKDGRAEIDSQSCINCGICMQACPYHAIIKLPIPCEETCPVGAMGKDSEGKEIVDESRCIHCGACMRECPFGALMEKSSIIDIARDLVAGRNITALYAPAIAAQFRAPLEKLETALEAAGFRYVSEVAHAADLVAVMESEEFIERRKHGKALTTTSCCPAWVEAVQKHLPHYTDSVSSTPSPMKIAARLAQERNPDSMRVFIGPCVAKRKEAETESALDAVMTAEELGALFVAFGIDVLAMPEAGEKQCATQITGIPAGLCGDSSGCAGACGHRETGIGESIENRVPVFPAVPAASRAGRGFAESGGVSSAIVQALSGIAARESQKAGTKGRPAVSGEPDDHPGLETPPSIGKIDGLTRETMKQLLLWKKTGCPHDFLEVMACTGGCVGGPAILTNPKVASAQLRQILGASRTLQPMQTTTTSGF